MLFQDYIFKNPEFFWLLLLVPLLIGLYFWKMRHRHPVLQIPSMKALKLPTVSWLPYLRHLVFSLQLIAFVFFVIALARPRLMEQEEKVNAEVVDIVISLDISGSMLAQDFKPDRIEAAKNLSVEFIENRPEDRIGLVIFAGESFTQSPITADKQVLKSLIDAINIDLLTDGTAIGMGLATAVDRLKDSDAASKVIILLSDGVNNTGFIDPKTAMEMAKKLGIRVYTIGVGSEGEAPFPHQDAFGRKVLKNVPVEIDEALLEEIAKETGGAYFRATDNASLSNIYAQIDEMEKTTIDVEVFKKYKEAFLPFGLIGLFCFLSAFSVNLMLKKFP